jgi:hypothetical protein
LIASHTLIQNTARKPTLATANSLNRISTLDLSTLGELIYDSEEDEPPSPTSPSSSSSSSPRGFRRSSSSRSWVVGKRQNELLIPPPALPSGYSPSTSPPAPLLPLTTPTSLQGKVSIPVVGTGLGSRSKTPPPSRPKLSAEMTWQGGSPSIRNALRLGECSSSTSALSSPSSSSSSPSSISPRSFQLKFSATSIPYSSSTPPSSGSGFSPSSSPSPSTSSVTTDSLSWVSPRKQNKEGERNKTGSERNDSSLLTTSTHLFFPSFIILSFLLNLFFSFSYLLLLSSPLVQKTSRRDFVPRVFAFETQKINTARKAMQKVLEVSLDKQIISSYHTKKQTTVDRQGSELLQVSLLSSLFVAFVFFSLLFSYVLIITLALTFTH